MSDRVQQHAEGLIQVDSAIADVPSYAPPGDVSSGCSDELVALTLREDELVALILREEELVGSKATSTSGTWTAGSAIADVDRHLDAVVHRDVGHPHRHCSSFHDVISRRKAAGSARDGT